MKFDHIGIFVKEIDYGQTELSKVIEIFKKSEIFHDTLLNVSVQFCYDKCGICYELVAPYGENNPVESVLKVMEIFSIILHIKLTNLMKRYCIFVQ